MARLFPLRSEPSTGNTQPRVVDLEDEDADAVFGALSSTTAREIYATLNEQPRTPSDVADAIDSSIQNVRYHLEKLESAGLIEVVDTWYSSRGNEMSVYAAADGPLIVTSDRSTADRLKAALSRYLGGIFALAGASLFVQYGLERFFGPGADDFDDSPEGGGGAAGDSENGAAEDPDDGAAADGTRDDADGGATDGGAIDDEAEDSDATTAEEEGTRDDADFDSADEGGSSGDGADLEDAESVDGNESNATEPGGGDDAGFVDSATEGTNATDGGVELAEAVFAAIPPGMFFFLGGLFVLTAVTVYWYWRTY